MDKKIKKKVFNFRNIYISLITDIEYNMSGFNEINFNTVMVEVMIRVLYFVGVAPPLSEMSPNSSLLC